MATFAPAAVRWWRRSRPDLGPLGPNRLRIHGFSQAMSVLCATFFFSGDPAGVTGGWGLLV
jgi:hypothetical protein